MSNKAFNAKVAKVREGRRGKGRELKSIQQLKGWSMDVLPSSEHPLASNQPGNAIFPPLHFPFVVALPSRTLATFAVK
jgi:hypothetical protein